ncbi:spore cortex biosynthesis protein YabQ [Litchfieldia salsa]|uniref:Spore cortex biosynthesis protein YabQ n=1 Tax=Litchfieldia salsa TaxID=930152 RepID=A0A1H0WZF4_9BACI|nr:spore cortex biosynthesis protein YabQ [Litchfieldia salsa]SDP95990.1 spore cortex biosynthesis protein YabQ [Litchfieldia salsa]
MSLTTQFYTMLAMVGMGSWLGAALDTYGRFLKRPKRAHWVIFINDLLFWLFQGLIIFYTLLLVNEGELRFYVFIALVCGYAAYQSILKGWYNRGLEVFIQFMVGTYRFLEKAFRLVIIRPIRGMVQSIIVLLLGIFNFIVILANFLLKAMIIILKIIFAPFKWIGLLLWKLIPIKIRRVLEKYFYKFAGINQKLQNMKHIIHKLWKKIRKS